MEGRKIESALSLTSQKNITPRQLKYIELCKQTLEVKERIIRKDDFFFNEVLGIDKSSSDQSSGFFYSQTSCKIRDSESIWLPTVDQIKELFHSHLLGHQIDNFDLYVEKEKITASSIEELWLKYYRSIFEKEG